MAQIDIDAIASALNSRLATRDDIDLVLAELETVNAALVEIKADLAEIKAAVIA